MKQLVAWFLLVVSGLTPLTTIGQTPTVQWQKRFGDRSKDEYMSQLVELSPKRFAVCGNENTSLPYGQNCCVTSTSVIWIFNQRGDSIRTIKPPFPFNEDNGIIGVTRLPKGDLLLLGIAGDRTLTGAAGRASGYNFLMRIDTLGRVRWRQKYNQGLAWVGTDPRPPLLLPDGGALVTVPEGFSSSFTSYTTYAKVIRVDSVGNVIWQRRYGPAMAELNVAVPLPDGSFALSGGLTGSTAQNTAIPWGWLLRIKANGDSLSSRFFGNATDSEGFSDLKVLPDGNLLLAGSRFPQAYSSPQPPTKGWLLKLDPAGNTLWSYDMLATGLRNGKSCGLLRLEVMQGGDIVVRGYRYATSLPGIGYLARLRLPPAGSGPSTPPTTIWELQVPKLDIQPSPQFLGSDGSLTVGWPWEFARRLPLRNTQHTELTRFQGVGQAFQYDFCAIPPVANLSYGINPAGTELSLYDVSSPGPAQAQLVRWRWDFGDGTSYSGLTPPTHNYGTQPPFGTQVQLTVTNNLGCTSTVSLYPWGGPLATQASKDLARQLSLYPNPTSATLTLTLPTAEPVLLSLRNSLGQLVKAEQSVRPQGGLLRQELDLSLLPAGVYLLHVQTSQATTVKRVVKQ